MGAIVTRAIATVGTLKIMAFVGATVSMVCLSISWMELITNTQNSSIHSLVCSKCQL